MTDPERADRPGWKPLHRDAGSMGSSRDPFDAQPDPFGADPDPLGADRDAFGSGPDPFGSGPDPFASGQDSLGSGQDPFGSGRDSLDAAQGPELFSTETKGLDQANVTPVVRLHDGDTFDLTVRPVRKTIAGSDLRMLGYNGSIPGPTLHVDQGSEITVNVTNQGDLDTTVHWHGLRLENRYDGVPHETQQPIPIGQSFTYKIQFPDAGFYWYHPHIREDFGQELGLYGTIIVEPADEEYWPPADQQYAITLDDVLIEEGHIAPFRRHGTTYTAMGRFGNVMLVAGDTEFCGEAQAGEVVRLNLVNTANTRLFNFGLRGARMKLIGGDSGRYEHETFVDEVLLAPSERAIVDVLLEQPGEVRLEHRTPEHTYDLGTFTVRPGEGEPDDLAAEGEPEGATAEGVPHDASAESQSGMTTADAPKPESRRAARLRKSRAAGCGGAAHPLAAAAAAVHARRSQRQAEEAREDLDDRDSSLEFGVAAAAFEQLRDDPELTAIRRSLQHDLDREPDKILSFVSKMPLLYGDQEAEASSYACPMHPEVTSTEPGTCPKCGMKLVPVPAIVASSYACPMHPEVTSTEPGTCPKCGMKLIPVGDQATLVPESTEEMHAHGMHEHETHQHGTSESERTFANEQAAEAHSDETAAHDTAVRQHGEMHEHDMAAHEHGGDGLEWEDLMPEINRATDESNMIWQIIDKATGAENAAIAWEFTVGDRVKIRLINEMESDHPMHHPFHIHGAGRFLILARNGVVEPNLVWKDTVLMRAGETVDILLDVSNPGLWMAHCHIAEHMQTGMMFSFNVLRARATGKAAGSGNEEAA